MYALCMYLCNFGTMYGVTSAVITWSPQPVIRALVHRAVLAVQFDTKLIQFNQLERPRHRFNCTKIL